MPGKWLEKFQSVPEATQGDEIDIAPAIAIAIDRKTGSALLLFKDQDAQTVQPVADVHRAPFKVKLTADQRRELQDSLTYYKGIESRKAGR